MNNNRSNVQTAALVAGVVFLAVGVLGFVPGITTNYNQLSFAGHESEAMLLGIFQVSVLHNIVHLLFGVLGIAASKSRSNSRNFLIGSGVVYLLLTAYGYLIDQNTAANFVPVNHGDNLLHLALGLGLLAAGLVLGKNTAGNNARL